MKWAIGFILLAEFTWNGWRWFGEQLWYRLVAVMFVYATACMVSRTEGKEQVIWQAATGLAVANLVDELIFDPTSVGVNDYVFLIGTVLWTWQKLMDKNDRPER